MTPKPVDPHHDPAGTANSAPLTITLDGTSISGSTGQSVAGIILASGVQAWRRTSVAGRPRGVFCGIGVCFDCVVTVNDLADVRACLRRARNGDVVVSQHDELPMSQPEPGGPR